MVNETYEASYVDEVYEASVVGNVYIAGTIIEGDAYHGSYRVTPGRENIRLYTDGLLMEQDVIVEKIPDNYGLVERVGMTLRIS